MLTLQTFFFRLTRRFSATDGQDLVEYALLIALVCLGVVAGIHTVANDVSASFAHLSTSFAAQV